MERVQTITALKQTLSRYKQNTIGFVPTMGYLHEGHLQLIRQAKEECDKVVLSIFVNPLQFGPNEDFDQYPRDMTRDCRVAEEAEVDLVFHPTVDEMYPSPTLTTVQVKQMTDVLCGKSRPGHFDGVCTIVSKLFHLIQPDRAYFGLKDIQQVAVIQQMVQDLHMSVQIVACETVREEDGLAMSSRNVYLSPEERAQATIIYQSFQTVQERQWETVSEMRQYIIEQIQRQSLAQIDYVEILSYPSLQTIDTLDQPSVVAVAVYFGKTRLIDNLIL